VNPNTSDRKLMRKAMRMQRAAIATTEHNRIARKIAGHIDRALLLRPSSRIAVYLAVRGEVSLLPLIKKAHERGCELFIPTITDFRAGKMEFVALPEGESFIPNRYGLLETTKRGKRISPRHLDLVFTPLVAFDARGWRLGSGAGFYDRRFAFLQEKSAWRRPKLIGVAYSFQQVPSLAPERWDVPLDAVVTERGLLRMK
jgi:5-formyltetrahydrofolate cyclo-ligase